MDDEVGVVPLQDALTSLQKMRASISDGLGCDDRS
jgi:hypothetical protein